MTPSDDQPHNSTYNFNHTYMYCIFDMHCMIVYVLYTVYNIFCSWSLAYVIILPSLLYLEIIMSVPIARPVSTTKVRLTLLQNSIEETKAIVEETFSHRTEENEKQIKTLPWGEEVSN